MDNQLLVWKRAVCSNRWPDFKICQYYLWSPTRFDHGSSHFQHIYCWSPRETRLYLPQYADDTTIYQASKPGELTSCTISVQRNVDKLQCWANEANLVLNTSKTKYMLLSSTKLSSYHELNTTIISWVRRDKVWSPGFNVKMVLLSRETGSVSSGNLSAFDVISSKARETKY